jgi:hypothetical protein
MDMNPASGSDLGSDGLEPFDESDEVGDSFLSLQDWADKLAASVARGAAVVEGAIPLGSPPAEERRGRSSQERLVCGLAASRYWAAPVILSDFDVSSERNDSLELYSKFDFCGF